MTSPFKVGETYLTRNGEQVKVIDVDPSQTDSRVMVIRRDNGFIEAHHADGRLYSDRESLFDLMPPKPTPAH